MSATTASDIRTGIGARLKAGRERLGMTRLQVAEKLHVDPSVVEKLEAERFSEFVAPVYVKGHIKRYSEIVGENTQELLDQHSAMTKPVLPDLTQLPKASHHADPRKLVLPSLVVLIAFAVVGTVWWIVQNVGKTSFGNPAGPQSVDLTPEQATPDEPPGASEILPPEGRAPSTVPGAADVLPPSSASSATQSARSAQAPVPAQPTTPSGSSSSSTVPGAADLLPPSTAARSGGSLSSTAQSAPTANAGRGTGTRAGTTAGAASSAQITKSTRVAAAAPTEAPPPRLKSVDVTLKFAADSWAEVYDANGQRLFYDIGSANSSHAVTGTPPLRVVLGNAPGVTVNINGKPTKVPPSAVQNDSAQFTINRSGRIVRARPDEAASAASKPNGE